MTSTEDGRGERSLQQLMAVWQAWSGRDVIERAARRAEGAGDPAQARRLRALDDGPAVSAVEALAAQHEVSSLLAGWEWQTIRAARDEGATWADIGRAVAADPAAARTAYLTAIDRQEQAAARSGRSVGMTADEARAQRDVAGQWLAELRPDTPDRAVHDIETAIAGDDPEALAALQALWWDPHHRPHTPDEPIPFVLTDNTPEVVNGAQDAVHCNSDDTNAITDAHERGDQAAMERLHAGRPLSTPEPGRRPLAGADELVPFTLVDADGSPGRADEGGCSYRGADASALERTSTELDTNRDRGLADPDRPLDRVEPEVARLECPECGEDAVEQPPESLLPEDVPGVPVPRYAHPDGEPLCPVSGPSGYEPAQPREILDDESLHTD
ncbi:MAG: hypothetical protein L0K86_23875, partial [Actinomycetia bacterium]|nr:hypothetical protein [Actinomycetes bacterium]